MNENLVYFWFHHQYIGIGEQERINNIIREHDYSSFMKFFVWYELESLHPAGMTFFPEYAINENNEKVNILIRENFENISSCECECG